jgi:hypothetical protein
VHTCAHVHYTSAHVCTPVHYTGAHQCALVFFIEMQTIAVHRLPKSHAHLAPQWPRRLAAETSLALANPLASSPPSTCRHNTESYMSSRNHRQHQKDSFLYISTLPPRRSFVTHRHAHMRPYSLHRCASVRTCLIHRRAPKHTCSPYRCAHMHTCLTYRRALVRACSTHRHALSACLKSPLPHPHVRISGGQAHTCARLLPDRPCMWGPYPLNISIRPPVQPLPKKWNPISM